MENTNDFPTGETMTDALEWASKTAESDPVVAFATVEDDKMRETFYAEGFTTFRGYNAVKISPGEQGNSIDELLSSLRDTNTREQGFILWRDSIEELYLPVGITEPHEKEDYTLFFIRISPLSRIATEDPMAAMAFMDSLRGEDNDIK